MQDWLDEEGDGEDFVFPESLEAGELGGVIPESAEVITQRIKDLSNYLRWSLPEVYGPDAARTKTAVDQEKVDIILFELNEEFTSDLLHRSLMIAYLVSLTKSVVSQEVIDKLSEKAQDMSDTDDEEWEDFEISASVRWGELIPEFRSNGRDAPSALAKAHVMGMLNYYTDDETWEKIEAVLGERLSETFPQYWGFVGMYLLGSYIQVVIDKKVPTITVLEEE